jgi:hypothetical protein
VLQSHTETLKRHDEFRRQHEALLQREAELISMTIDGDWDPAVSMLVSLGGTANNHEERFAGGER